MSADFYLVHKSILPSCFPLVVKARELTLKDGLSVSEACKQVGLSRSLYYKYKDAVYAPAGSLPKRAILSLKTEDIPGVLSSILSVISASKANVLTISQDMPIHGLAFINLTINVRNLDSSLEELLQTLRGLPHVKAAEVLAYE